MYKLIDWYEGPDYPQIIGVFNTKEEARKAWIDYTIDTDGECKLEIKEGS